MSDVDSKISDPSLRIEILIADNKIQYNHNMNPQSFIFWLEAVKKIAIEDALEGGKESTDE